MFEQIEKEGRGDIWGGRRLGAANVKPAPGGQWAVYATS